MPGALRVAYPLMRHMHARVCRSPAIDYFHNLFFINPYPSQSQTQPGGGPSWAYSPYLPLESEASKGEDEKQAKQAFMHACVCSNQSILPLIIVQSSNLSLYSMFALLHCEASVTRDKQCACCIRSDKDLYVYTLFSAVSSKFWTSFFLIFPRSMRGIPTFIIYCMSRRFLIDT